MPRRARTEPDEIDLRLDLAAGADAPSRARAALRTLQSELSRDEMTSLGLAVSELVTNSVRHSGAAATAAISLRVVLTPEAARVEVTDPGEGFEPERHGASADERGGWGLYLVDQLAHRWWVESGATTRVICEFARP